jgi:hypothetical protein
MMDTNETIEAAILFTARAWAEWSSVGSVPPNINVRDRLTIFASIFRGQLTAKFPSLRAANEQILLLIFAEAIARSGTDRRAQIEAALQISLPTAD